jgi:hypothetical protein
MSFKEAKRMFLTPEVSLDDSLHIATSSSLLLRMFTRNQLSFMSRNSPSLPKEAKRTFLTPG